MTVPMPPILAPCDCVRDLRCKAGRRAGYCNRSTRAAKRRSFAYRRLDVGLLLLDSAADISHNGLLLRNSLLDGSG